MDDGRGWGASASGIVKRKMGTKRKRRTGPWFVAWGSRKVKTARMIANRAKVFHPRMICGRVMLG
jgi:hypothetical protein